jgi:hypothetical protein
MQHNRVAGQWRSKSQHVHKVAEASVVRAKVCGVGIPAHPTNPQRTSSCIVAVWNGLLCRERHCVRSLRSRCPSAARQIVTSSQPPAPLGAKEGLQCANLTECYVPRLICLEYFQPSSRGGIVCVGRRRHRMLKCRRSDCVAAVPFLCEVIAWKSLTILTVFVTVG